MKIYSRRKFIVGLGMLVLAVIFIFTTVLSGRINMLILLSGAVFVVIGINAVHSATVTDAWKCEDRDSEGPVKPVSREAREIEAKAAKAVLFAVQLLCLLAASIAAGMSINGTQRTTSHAASFTRGFISSIKALASLGVLFIFQLPAITALRSALFISFTPLQFYR